MAFNLIVLNILVLFLMALRSSSASAEVVLATDKAAHFGLSAVSTATLIRIGQVINPQHKITIKNRLVSSILVAAAGYAKEVSDSKKKGTSQLDRGDLNADGAGIVFGNILVIDF